MSYTINPNAKNKWARNAENTMDLSLETDASSVYLDNGRTLEQEFGEDSMVSNVATVDNSMSKVIDGTLDGAYESCVFKGKSLVNLMTKCKDEYVVRYHDINNPNNTVANISMMKPNTEYTLFYKAKYRTEGDGAGTSGGLKVATSIEQGFFGTGQKYTTEYMKYVYKFTTSSVVDCFIFASNGSYFAIKECVLLEGDYTNQDVLFFEGLCDVKMPILRNVGKNLSDGKLETGRYTQAEGEKFTDASAVRTINKIKVKPSTKYCLRTMDGTTIYNISEYHDGAYIGYKASGSSLVFTTSPTTNELHISFKTNNINLQYQLEEGSIATTYEDHKTNILRTPETVTLRSLPNGVRDELNLKTGEYIKRIGEIVLNGSEEWLDFDTVTNARRFRHKPLANTKEVGTIVCISDRLPTYLRVETGQVISSYTEHVGIEINSQEIWIYTKETKNMTTSNFKAWLQSNPVTVQYELAEPITTKVTLTQSEPIVKIGTELPNGVCDTYNLLTGEHIQRVGKVVLDGSEDWLYYQLGDATDTICFRLMSTNIDGERVKANAYVVSDRFAQINRAWNSVDDYEGLTFDTPTPNLYMRILKSRLSANDVNSFKQWLKENPTTVYYELANPIVTKKNGLPNTHGVTLPNGVVDKYNESTGVYTQNVGKVVLNGGETISLTDSSKENTIAFIIKDYKLNQATTGSGFLLCDRFQSIDHLGTLDVEGITYTDNALGRLLYIRINKSKLSEQNVNGFKKWLSDNVTTVYHQLATPKTIDIPLINVGQVLPNGVCDTYNPITKEYVKRVSQGVLDGTEENWILASNALTNTVRFATLNAPPFPDAKVSGSIISNLHFGNELSYENDKELIEINSGKDVVIRISRARLSSPDLDGFKKWIKKNPLTVWYELENPTTLTVDLDLSTLYSSSPIAYENGHIILESGHNGQSLLPTLEYSTVTNRVKQIESISKQVLRQEKQLTMLEQMLIQNIINLDYNNTLLTLKNEMEEML